MSGDHAGTVALITGGAQGLGQGLAVAFAGLIAYLAGPASGVMTGAVIDFDRNVPGGAQE